MVEKLTEALPNYAGSDGVEDVLYAHSDVLGSHTYLNKSDGDGYIAFDYGAWGEIDPSQTLNDFNFVVSASYTGHDYNFMLGVWFAQARLYDAVDRRFVAGDFAGSNIAIPQSVNCYIYVWDNPVAFIDILGLTPTKISGALITITWGNNIKSITNVYMQDCVIYVDFYEALAAYGLLMSLAIRVEL